MVMWTLFFSPAPAFLVFQFKRLRVPVRSASRHAETDRKRVANACRVRLGNGSSRPTGGNVFHACLGDNQGRLSC